MIIVVSMPAIADVEPCIGATAHHGWLEFADPKPGETAFITSASGGVGGYVYSNRFGIPEYPTHLTELWYRLRRKWVSRS